MLNCLLASDHPDTEMTQTIVMRMVVIHWVCGVVVSANVGDKEDGQRLLMARDGSSGPGTLTDETLKNVLLAIKWRAA
jgi:hypothetical protein